MAKNKLAKFAEMETLENVFQPTHEEVFRTDYKLKGKWGEQVFGNDHLHCLIPFRQSLSLFSSFLFLKLN